MEHKRQRRVGTVTLGCTLIFYGVLFLCHMVTETVSYALIFKLWFVIFILLGAEILVAAIRHADDSFRYDFPAILLICIMVCFAMAMAGMDWLYTHTEWFGIGGSI